MALVGYDSSSESDSDILSEKDNRVLKSTNISSVSATSNNTDNIEQVSTDIVNADLQLRIPKSFSKSKFESNLKRKRKNGKVLIPAFTSKVVDSDDEDAISGAKFQKVAVSIKSLVSILPPPKSSQETTGRKAVVNLSDSKTSLTSITSLVPHSVKLSKSSVITPEIKSSQSVLNSESAYDDDETEFIPTHDNEEFVNNNGYHEDDDVIDVATNESSFDDFNNVMQSSSMSIDSDAMPHSERRWMAKHGTGVHSSVLEVTQDSLMAGADVEQIKLLTIEREKDTYAHRMLANDCAALGKTAARKHQITWLAVKAKERQQELENSWAQGKFNRTQGRQKYGF